MSYFYPYRLKNIDQAFSLSFHITKHQKISVKEFDASLNQTSSQSVSSKFSPNLSSVSKPGLLTTNLESSISNSGKPHALNFDPLNRPRRQDWKGDLVENGMMYFAKRQLIETHRILQGGEKFTYVEVPQNLSIEIDSYLDLAHAEQTAIHEGLLPFLSHSS